VVRAGLATDPAAYLWSSARAHLAGSDDGLVAVRPLLEIAGDWGTFLSAGITDMEYKALRKHERTGRPLGGGKFVSHLEQKLGKRLSPQKGGRPKNRKTSMVSPDFHYFL